MRIRLAQCLCGPMRHAIMAVAINDTSLTDDQGLAILRTGVIQFLDGPGHPFCGICGRAASEWIYEIKWSREFADWDTALIVLKQMETDQRAVAHAMRSVN